MLAETTLLGDKPIKRMGFGAMQLAGPGVFGPPRDPVAARSVLRRAIELGVDHIDTSQYYGPDVVNDLIREALHPYPQNLKLVTKVGARRDDAGGVHPAQRPEELKEGVEANLRSLQVERLDLVNLRLVGTTNGSVVPLEEQLGALEELRQAGKLDLIGLSNVDQGQVEGALELADVAEIQNLYNILDLGYKGEDLPWLIEEHQIPQFTKTGLYRHRGCRFRPFFRSLLEADGYLEYHSISALCSNSLHPLFHG